MELYRLYRPKLLKEIKGQPEAVKTLSGFTPLTMPHVYFLTGPTGTGKTTIALYIKRKLKCDDFHFQDKNCADYRGIDFVRGLIEDAQIPPMVGATKVWLIDECHRLTGEAQDALLKLLENPPEHAYFILATSVPKKLDATLIGRCCHIPLKLLATDVVEEIVREVMVKAKIDNVPDSVLERIVHHAGGSARKALQELQKAAALKTEEEQLDCISPVEGAPEAIELARMLVYQAPKWPAVQSLLRKLEDDPEGTRRVVLATAVNCLMGDKTKFHARAYRVADFFRESWFDTDAKKANLVVACFELVQGGKD